MTVVSLVSLSILCSGTGLMNEMDGAESMHF